MMSGLQLSMISEVTQSCQIITKLWVRKIEHYSFIAHDEGLNGGSKTLHAARSAYLRVKYWNLEEKPGN